MRGCACGWADFGSDFSADRKSATTWSLGIVPAGPSDVCMKSRSVSVWNASSRLRVCRRTSLIV